MFVLFVVDSLILSYVSVCDLRRFDRDHTARPLTFKLDLVNVTT